jgi:hypothetical protein
MGAPTNAAYVKEVLANSEPSTHGWIVLQNDFEPWSEENFFQIKVE